jgi:hypothetical protein
MVSDQEDDVGYRFFKIVDNINVEIKRLRCPSYCLCAPLPENSLGWCKVSINKYSDLEKLKDDLIRTINFEINEFGVLRLEDHLDDFSQAYLMPIDPEKKDHEINEMLSRLKIKPEKIKLAQLTFKHKKVSEFYKSKDIDIKSKTFLRYLDNPALLQNVIRCTLSFGLLERIESLLDKNKTSDEQLACFVNYMLDGIKFIRGCPEKKVIEQFMENSEVYFDIFDKTSSILHSVCGEHFKGKLLGVAQEIELFKKFCAENQKSPLNKSSPNI